MSEEGLTGAVRSLRETISEMLKEVREFRQSVFGDIISRKPLREGMRLRLGQGILGLRRVEYPPKRRAEE